MPLFYKRIQPVNLGRLPDDKDDGPVVVDSLEEMNNRNMVNVIRQLSDLTQVAHNLFQSLEDMVEDIQQRTDSLNERMKKLTITVESMKNNKEKNLNGFKSGMPTEFTSNYETSRGLFTSDSRPHSFQKLYETNCDPIPNFDLLQQFSSEEKCSKKYTDPEFFFLTWRMTMLEEAAGTILDGTATQTKNRKGKDRNFVPRAIVTTRDTILKRELRAGNVALLQVPEQPFAKNEESSSPAPTPPPPLRTPDIPYENEVFYTNDLMDPIESDSPSPQPDIYYPPPMPDISFPPPPAEDEANAPPPPPPPPPILSHSPKPQTSMTQMEEIQSISLKPVEPQEARISPRDDMLQQIQAGMQLRKTSFKSINKSPVAKNFDNVEDILAHVLETRRDAVMDDDSSSDEEYFQF